MTKSIFSSDSFILFLRRIIDLLFHIFSKKINFCKENIFFLFFYYSMSYGTVFQTSKFDSIFQYGRFLLSIYTTIACVCQVLFWFFSTSETFHKPTRRIVDQRSCDIFHKLRTSLLFNILQICSIYFQSENVNYFTR